MSGPDVVVVGARVAGAATAMLLARAGLRVTVLDRSPYGSDTLSTHALMRAGVMQLSRWGLLDAVIASGAPAVRRTTSSMAGSPPAAPRTSDTYASRRSTMSATCTSRRWPRRAACPR